MHANVMVACIIKHLSCFSLDTNVVHALYASACIEGIEGQLQHNVTPPEIQSCSFESRGNCRCNEKEQAVHA